MKKEQIESNKILKENSDCLEIFKISKCKILPWIGRNKYIVAILFTGVSLWLSIIDFSMDWITRAIQWKNQLP